MKKEIVIKGNKYIAEIKPYLSIEDMIELNDNIVNMVLSIEDDYYRYSPEIFDFVCQLNIILKYTNLELPSDPEECWTIINEDKLFEIVSDVIGHEIVEKIEIYADKTISANLNKLNGFYEIGKMISAIISKMDEIEKVINNQEEIGKEINNLPIADEKE